MCLVHSVNRPTLDLGYSKQCHHHDVLIVMFRLSKNCDVPVTGFLLIFSILIVVVVASCALSKIQKETRSNQAKVETRFVSSEAACQDKANGHQAHDPSLSLSLIPIRFLAHDDNNRCMETLPKEVKLEEKIASGAYGEVWRGALHDRWIVAIKKLFPSSSKSSSASKGRSELKEKSES